jgi:hypothetical protein
VAFPAQGTSRNWRRLDRHPRRHRRFMRRYDSDTICDEGARRERDMLSHTSMGQALMLSPNVHRHRVITEAFDSNAP